MAKDSLELEVKFEKIGNKIKFTLPVKMYCNRMKKEIQNTGTYDKTDNLYRVWLGKNIDTLFKKSNVIYKKVCLGQAYSKCDVPMGK